MIQLLTALAFVAMVLAPCFITLGSSREEVTE
jgi:hypothetical protein